MPVSKEEKMSRQLKRAKGKDPDKAEKKKKPAIVRKPHPQKSKMLAWVAATAVIICLIGAVGMGLRVKYNKNTAFSEKYGEFKQGLGETWSQFSGGPQNQGEAEEKTEKAIISNPDDLSPEEIEELEKKAFPENGEQKE